MLLIMLLIAVLPSVAYAAAQFALCYSTDGLTYSLVPNALNGDGVGHWNASQSGLNNGATSGVLTGALTPVAGTTQVDATPTASASMSEDTSKLLRWIPRVGAIAGQTRYFRPCYADGSALEGYTIETGARVDVLPTQAGF